jgi:hypothetical protein
VTATRSCDRRINIRKNGSRRNRDRRRTCALPHQTVHSVKQARPAFPAFFHILHSIERLYEWASRQPPKAIYTSSQFAWTDALEASWPDILGELAAVLRDWELIPAFQEISPEQLAITQDQKWKTYVLAARNRPGNSLYLSCLCRCAQQRPGGLSLPAARCLQRVTPWKVALRDCRPGCSRSARQCAQ